MPLDLAMMSRCRGMPRLEPIARFTQICGGDPPLTPGRPRVPRTAKIKIDFDFKRDTKFTF